MSSIRKIIFLDLDGTILTNRKQITSELKELCRELLQKHRIILSTGRSPVDTIKFHYELGLHDYMMCNNGAFIWNPSINKILYCQNFSDGAQIIRYLVHNFQFYSIKNIAIFSNNKVYLLNHSTDYLHFVIDNKWLKAEYIGLNSMLSINQMQRMVIEVDVIQKKTLVEELSVLSDSRININGWREDDNILDIMPQDINKGMGMDYIIKNEHIPSKNTIAFGDSDNDIEILSKAYFGIAMKNSTKKIQDASNYITTYDNDNNGVYDFIINSSWLLI